jgi:hypothetical protein
MDCTLTTRSRFAVPVQCRRVRPNPSLNRTRYGAGRLARTLLIDDVPSLPRAGNSLHTATHPVLSG